ncbi:hemophore-related protein [[Mycobacterium] burgundiense]|uniref:Hemophore-related protein n=1 Tax=[Mycobacterium] burgundiense TaxID=3064286 RepID=A0ABM9M6W0_9MYCO|nr:hemophore-related protein [Mycolicibacterium sp. MU0053]CAJ1510906.1 hemophore-related protein [Mycolicibacterium sp. MU0053]
MIKPSLTKLAVAASGLALSLSAGAGFASADPTYGPMVDTTCSFDQAMTAVRTENPMAARYLDQSPPNVQFLRVYLGSPRDERINLLNQIKDNPGANQALPVFQQMLTSCTKY